MAALPGCAMTLAALDLTILLPREIALYLQKLIAPRYITGFLVGLLATSFSAWGDAKTAPQHLTVLQYHHVSSSTPASTSISPERFADHLNWLSENGYQIVRLEDALQAIQAGEPLPDKSAAITFDDGYLDNYTTAFPLLRERQWPFTIFVNSAPHDAGQRGWASWEQLREMSEAGATIANHTTHHTFLIRRLADESETDWLTRIRADIENAEQRIRDETGQSHKILAYPYGESDKQVRQLVEEMGYIAFGQQSGPVGANSDFYNLPRFPLSGIYSALDSFATKMRALPLEVVQAVPATASEDNLLSYAENKPLLTLELAGPSPAALNCFASGQGAIAAEAAGENRYIVQANTPLPTGRSRYNCTQASAWPGRYYWFSYAWVRQDETGAWSHQ